MNLRNLLEARVTQAMQACGLVGNPQLQTAARPEFGDYQVNGIMALAKQAKRNPRELAAEVVAALQTADITDAAEIAGPGFINLRFRSDALGAALESSAGIEQTTHPQTVVIDYSAPNLAKEMHVGHLRSTIIGDAMVRTLEALGHRVIKQNHVGDWGTQFGMLLTHMQGNNENTQVLADLEAFYVQAKQRFDNEPEFAEQARANVVALQSGNPEARAAWQQFINISQSHCQAVYERLGVLLQPADVMPESAYNDDLAPVIAALREQGLLVESDGALCVFLDQFKGKDGTPLPLIVQKTDGGFLYATTDLAAIRHRHKVLHADRVLYFVDARQTLHFRQVFAVAQTAGFAPQTMRLEHLPFGAMLGKDGRPFKTRAGGTVKLVDLLMEAELRARAIVDTKSKDAPAAERDRIAHAVGIGAVKYADLSKHRTNDYVFDWDQMLSFDGNTAPYLQYAHARICSIFRRANIERASVRNFSPTISHAAERDLAMRVLQFDSALWDTIDKYSPHRLCTYLYDLAASFSSFYEQCPVLKAETETERDSRLMLCDLTARVMQTGLGVLGIEAPEQM